MIGSCCCIRCRMELHHYDELDRHPAECLNPVVYREYATCSNCGAILSLSAPRDAHRCVPPPPKPSKMTERPE